MKQHFRVHLRPTKPLNSAEDVSLVMSMHLWSCETVVALSRNTQRTTTPTVETAGRQQGRSGCLDGSDAGECERGSDRCDAAECERSSNRCSGDRSSLDGSNAAEGERRTRNIYEQVDRPLVP